MDSQNQNPRTDIIGRLKQANNVLVTVSQNPSVDQLSAAIGLTLMLNSLDKHATAVFSGQIPNTLEFLKPTETLETNTDSLRDFIISLDKAKADKLRYKVEDKVVRIFITPYRTSLSENDLVFGQGDFNVDVVVALGVHEKEDLDQAITNHGRILHDATVITVNTVNGGQVGSINWVEPGASSLSEMLVPVCDGLKVGALDAQMATAFLTGIVAETQRFSNEKTSSDTMNVSAKLMSAGANQQLVATQLEQNFDNGGFIAQPADESSEQTGDGSLEIDHDQNVADEGDETEVGQDDEPTEESNNEYTESDDNSDGNSDEIDEHVSRIITSPPSMGGQLTANTEMEHLDPSTDPMTVAQSDMPILSRSDDSKNRMVIQPLGDSSEDRAESVDASAEVAEQSDLVLDPFQGGEEAEPVLPPLPSPPAEPERVEEPAPEPEIAPEAEPEPEEEPDQTLADLEEAVDSPHLDEPAPDPAAALAAAHEAFNEAPTDPAAEETTPPETQTEAEAPAAAEPTPVEPAVVSIDPATGQLTYPESLVPLTTGLPSDPTAAVFDPTAPPPVPPPMAMPPLMPPTDSDELPPVNQ